jgi:hypothetical protein
MPTRCTREIHLAEPMALGPGRIHGYVEPMSAGPASRTSATDSGMQKRTAAKAVDGYRRTSTMHNRHVPWSHIADETHGRVKLELSPGDLVNPRGQAGLCFLYLAMLK